MLAASLVFGEGKGGYSGWSASKQALDQAAKLKAPWTQHDLRRTAATRMADLGVAPHIIEAVLNHVSGHKAGVAGIYNRSSYATEKRAALELWAQPPQGRDRQGRGQQRASAQEGDEKSLRDSPMSSMAPLCRTAPGPEFRMGELP